MFYSPESSRQIEQKGKYHLLHYIRLTVFFTQPGKPAPDR